MRGVALAEILVCLGTRAEIEKLIEGLIEALDAVDGDADLEPSLGSLGSTASTCTFDQYRWATGGLRDFEEDFENEAVSARMTSLSSKQAIP